MGAMNKGETAAGGGEARAAELLRRFDRNGDGRLDDDERAAAKEDMLREQMNLQMARAASIPGGAEAFRKRMLELFDRDGDGRLDDDERAAAQRFARERGFSPNGELRDDLLRRFDRNANGRIDDDERGALQEFVRERLEQGPPAGEAGASAPRDAGSGEGRGLEAVLRAAIERDPAQRAQFDTDRDGRLSDREWSAARARIARSLATAPERSSETVAAELARRRQAQEKEAASAKPLGK